MNKSRRSEVANYRMSHRRELSADARVIIALMRRQPQKLDELCRSAGIHQSTFYRMRPLLINRGILKETVWGYALWFYSELDEKVKRTIENLRFRLLRDPTIQEVAREIGETPEETHKLVWRLILETEWREPSEEQIRQTPLKLHQIYEIASLLQYFDEESVRKRPRRGHLLDEPIDKIFDRAKYALKHERDKLPRITFVKEDDRQIEFDYHWPESTEELGWQWGDASEIYDKVTKSFSGAFTGERQIKIEEEEEIEIPSDE